MGKMLLFHFFLWGKWDWNPLPKIAHCLISALYCKSEIIQFTKTKIGSSWNTPRFEFGSQLGQLSGPVIFGDIIYKKEIVIQKRLYLFGEISLEIPFISVLYSGDQAVIPVFCDSHVIVTCRNVMNLDVFGFKNFE